MRLSEYSAEELLWLGINTSRDTDTAEYQQAGEAA